MILRQRARRSGSPAIGRAPWVERELADEQRCDNEFESDGFRAGQLTAGEGTGLHAKLAERLPHRRFVMIGGSAAVGERLRQGYFEAIRDRADKLPNVEFQGFLPLAEVEKWFDRGRVLVNTSVYEGMPNTFMQAWARGIPTVATVDVGARLNGSSLYEVVSKSGDAAGEIERLLGDELHWARASARCREYFDATHSSAEVLGRYAKIFRELGS